MSDDTISELVKVRDALYETIDGLRRQLTAAQIRVAELECSLRFSFQAEVRQLRQQLAARDAEIDADNAEIAALRDRIDGLHREAAVAARDDLTVREKSLGSKS